MDNTLKNKIILAAMTGLVAGLQGCGAATTPSAHSADGESANEKNGCGGAMARKNGCGGMASSSEETKKPASDKSASDKSAGANGN